VSRLLAWAAALAAAGILVGAAAWTVGLSYQRGTRFAPGSSYRSDADGVRALFLLLEETGHRPARLVQPSPPPGALLVMVEPRLVSPDRDRQVVEWIEAGGHLLLAVPRRPDEPSPSPAPSPSSSRRPSGKPSPAEEEARPAVPLAERLGLRAERAEAALEAPEGSPLASVRELEGETAAQRFAVWPRGARVLAGSGAAPVLVELAVGRGTVTALADPALLENAGIARTARLELALALLLGPGRPVVFDELAHGVAESPGLAYVLARYGLLPAAFAALLFLALLAWRTSPAEAPPSAEGAEGEVRDSLVDARAALYARTLRPRDALRLLERDLRHPLSRRLGSRRPLPWRELERRLRERHPALAPRLREALEELGRFKTRPPRSLADLVPFARRLTGLIQEVR